MGSRLVMARMQDPLEESVLFTADPLRSTDGAIFSGQGPPGQRGWCRDTVSGSSQTPPYTCSRPAAGDGDTGGVQHRQSATAAQAKSNMSVSLESLSL